MFEFDDNLCEKYGIDDEDLDSGFRFGLSLLETHTHLFNAAMHLYFEWSQTEDSLIEELLLVPLRTRMIKASVGNMKEMLKNDKLWYAALMQGDEIE